MGRFNVWGETVTEASAAEGDVAAAWSEAEAVSLGDAVRAARTRPGGYEDCGRWFVTIDSEPDYRTGESTTYSVHPPRTITPASYARLARVLTGRARRAGR
jgi:hypothetical protein